MTEVGLLVNLGTTLVLVGLIWTIQLCVYPLFALVPEREFREYHRHHSRNITVLVGPLMLAELVSALLLVVWPPAAIGRAPFVGGLVLLVLVWASTAFLQVPAHDALGERFSAVTHRKLVTTNWVRTVLWSARGALLVWVVGVLSRSSL